MDNETSLPLCGCGLNIEGASDGYYRRYVLVLNAVLLPILAFSGIIGNVLNLIVYSRRSMRCSLNYYLAFLAVSDILVSSTAVFMFTFESLRGTNPGIRGVYLSGIAYVFPMAMVAQTCSIYYTVAAGVDCFIATVRPAKKKIYCTFKRAIMVGIIVLILALIYNATRWYEIEIINCYDHHFNLTTVDVCPSQLRQNKLYNEIYYLNMYTVVMSIGPIVVLFVLNVVVLRATVLKKNYLIRSTTSSPDINLIRARCGSDNSNCIGNKSADTVSLICVVCLFLLCNILSLIINFIETFTDVGIAVAYLIDLSNFLVVLNSSVNFLIYISFGENFRQTVKKMFSVPTIKRSNLKYTRELSNMR